MASLSDHSTYPILFSGETRELQDPPGTILLRSGRRLSTRDFIEHIRRLDRKGTFRDVDLRDSLEELKRELRRPARTHSDVGNLTLEKDYFASWSRPFRSGEEREDSEVEEIPTH